MENLHNLKIKQKAIEIDSEDYPADEINEYINKGWYVKHIATQPISTGSTYTAKGNYLVIFEKYE